MLLFLVCIEEEFSLYNMDSASAFEMLVALHLGYCTMLLNFDAFI